MRTLGLDRSLAKPSCGRAGVLGVETRSRPCAHACGQPCEVPSISACGAVDGNFSAQLHDVVAAGDQPGDDRAVVVPNGLYSTPPGTTTHHLGTHVTGGVDTHADLHVATALDHLGGVLGTAEFRTTAAGYRKLLAWLRGFGPMHQVGVEGTGSYGAGLARHLTEQGVAVIEVARPNRQLRRRHGKSDTLDAVAAARAVLSGEASATPKTHDGPVEALRTLKVVQRSANKARTQALNQLHALVLTAPDELRERLRTLKTAELVRTCAAFRIAVDDDGLTAIVRLALRELAQRIGHLGAQLKTVVARLHRITKSTVPAPRHRWAADTDPALAPAPGPSTPTHPHQRADTGAGPGL